MGRKLVPNQKCDARIGNLSGSLCLQGAQPSSRIWEHRQRDSPLLSGSKRWGEMAWLLIRAADLCTCCARGREHHLAFHRSKPGLLSSEPRGQNHVRHSEGKEFKPPCLTAPSISFVLPLLMLLSRPHTWCSAKQTLWKGILAMRSRVCLEAWVSSR